MSRWTRYLVTTFSLLLVLSACSVGNPVSLTTKWVSQSFTSLFSQNQSVISQMQSNYTSSQLQAALVIVAETLVNRDPSAQELQMAGNGFADYQNVVTGYLNSPDFQTEQLTYYENFFGTVFTSVGTNSSIDYNEPANLAAYLVVNDIDFRQILSATYCVQNNSGTLAQVPCSAFGNPSDATTQAAGVLTTQAFLSQTAGAFNLHRANAAFEAFACRNFLFNPDTRDPGLQVDEVSGAVKTFNCNNGANCNPICFDCHKDLNSRAALFYNFDGNGKYNPSGAAAGSNAQTDTGNASTVADLLVSPAQPQYFGQAVNSLQAYGTLFSQNRDFRDCLAQRLTNQMLGGNPTDPLPPQMQDIRDHIDLNGFKIKSILLEIAGHPAFVNR